MKCDAVEEYNQPVSRESKVMEELEESYARSKAPAAPTVTSADDEDEDDALAYFSRLAE